MTTAFRAGSAIFFLWVLMLGGCTSYNNNTAILSTKQPPSLVSFFREQPDMRFLIFESSKEGLSLFLELQRDTQKNQWAVSGQLLQKEKQSTDIQVIKGDWNLQSGAFLLHTATQKWILEIENDTTWISNGIRFYWLGKMQDSLLFFMRQTVYQLADSLQFNPLKNAAQSASTGYAPYFFQYEDETHYIELYQLPQTDTPALAVLEHYTGQGNFFSMYQYYEQHWRPCSKCLPQGSSALEQHGHRLRFKPSVAYPFLLTRYFGDKVEGVLQFWQWEGNRWR